MPDQKLMVDSRQKRRRVVWGEAHYREIQLGLSFRNVRQWKPPSIETREVMRRTVEAYLAGKLESFSDRKVGRNAMQRRVHRYTFQEEHPTRKGTRAVRSAECPLTIKFVSSVLYHSRDSECEDEDWDTGKPIKPWITISADDGSCVRVHAIMTNGDGPEEDDGLGKGVMDDETDDVDTEPDDEDTEEAVHGRGGEGRLKKKKRGRR